MKREKNLETILTISTGLLILYLIFDVKLLLAFAIVISIVGLFLEFLSSRITWLWMNLAIFLGRINSKILLTLVFFIFLVPIAFVYRIFNKDVLKLKRNKHGTHYFNRDHEFSSKDFDNIW